jgi:alpha-ketoglutarate-dependent 2,4-dichlorophenoxyacetate dioxygenase
MDNVDYGLRLRDCGFETTGSAGFGGAALLLGPGFPVPTEALEIRRGSGTHGIRDATMPLQIDPILPAFGAEISGVDITRPLDEATKQEILDAQAKWGVTVWRNTGLTDETHIEFSRIFGHIELAPKPKDFRTRHKHRELFDASNLDADGNIIDNEMVRLHKKGDQLWHTDSSFMPVRSAYSLLLCHEAPPEGGATWFADTRSAYEDLPQAMKDKIGGLEATNSLWWSRKLAGYPFTEDDVDERPHATHPLVHVHKPSGRKALYIAAHTRDVVGMDREEGRALIRELIAWATQPQYVFNITYKPGDMTIWDNLCSMHRGGEYDAVAHRRDMRRTTIREAGIVPDDYDPFTDLFDKAGKTAFNARAEQPAR